MACNESDDEPSLLTEISKRKRELANLDDELYYLETKRRLINHRIADLQYELRQRNSNKTKKE